ncbi:MAG: glycosyl transferase family 1 [Roseobacter sp.]|nr:glycosyl transferase family 1 [Roseobacter sp.]MBV47866.1 glycosyl transferase family 1 [Roseobacter sp.]
MARSLIAALEWGGATVTLASTLRSRDGVGDRHVQRLVLDQAQTEISRLVPQGRLEGWQAWVTYHNYYKAPDLIGPQVAQRLGIPYLLIETSRARSRLTGPWSQFAEAAERASDAANVIFYLTQHDAEAIERDRPDAQHLIHLPPFLAHETLPAPSSGDGPMLVAGMLRHGDKFESYKIIAETLATLPPHGWSLNIAGDGPARPEVEALMSAFGPAVTFLGQLDRASMARAYRDASLFFWPGVNEAFGLVYLEAQASGLPVVAQNRPGVCDVLARAAPSAPHQGVAPLAAQITELLTDTRLRAQRGAEARRHIAAHHLLPTAARTLQAGLAACGVLP